MTATLYSHDDVGAPQLTSSNDGAVYDIFKAVLITGYGSRAQAAGGAWSLAFDDDPNHKMVLQSTQLPNVFFRMEDSFNDEYAEILMFRTMSDIDTGTDQVPNATTLGSNRHYFSRRYNSNGWFMLVEDTGKWFYYFHTNTTYPGGLFVGQIDLINPSWPNANVFISGRNDTSIISTEHPHTLFNSAQPGWYAQDDPWQFQERGGQRCELMTSSENMSNPSPIDGNLYYQKMYLKSDEYPTQIIGTMPNMLYAWGSEGILFNEQKVVFNTKNYINMTYGNGFLFEYDSDTA